MNLPPLPALYFDGVSPLGQPVVVHLVADALELHPVSPQPPEGVGPTVQRIALRDIQWPERQRHGQRLAHFAQGGALQCEDSAAWDALADAAGQADTWVVRVQQSWRGTLAAVLALVALSAASFVWGVPWAAGAVLLAVPASVDQRVGDATLKSLDGSWLKPSELPAQRQQVLRASFQRALDIDRRKSDRAHTSGGLTSDAPTLRLEFRQSTAGPNAFTLPGGTLIITDELIDLADGQEDMLIGVLGHEAGHAEQRHGMRMLVQATLIGMATSVALGDFSSTLAAAPALLGQQAYSRDFEREADVASLRILRANGLSGAPMVAFFERISRWEQAHHGGGELQLLASHPVHEERIAFFRGGQ